ncbi:MAG: hypothetical protein H0X73_14685 [Chthoniobacterales bacterium]|nr:hypothetical protein [Chthoniobacterales bacterium]
MSSHLVHSCDDVRYAGPMKKIEYEYVQYPEAESWGQLKKEKNATTHQTVSEIIYPPYDPARLATDPAGASRKTVPARKPSGLVPPKAVVP